MRGGCQQRINGPIGCYRKTLPQTSQLLSILYICDYSSSPIGTLPDPHIRGLENGLFIPEGENITCQVHYHWSGNVTFAWELDRNGGPKLHLPGHMESVFQHRNNTATFVWALNFTLDHSHRGNKLRCVARVNNMIHRNYSATDERRILVYGMFMRSYAFLLYKWRCFIARAKTCIRTFISTHSRILSIKIYSTYNV